MAGGGARTGQHHPLPLHSHRLPRADSAGAGLVVDGQDEGAVGPPGGGNPQGRSHQVGGGADELPAVCVAEVAQHQEFPLRPEDLIPHLGPQVTAGGGLGLRPALHLESLPLLPLPPPLQTDPGTVQHLHLQLRPALLAQVVVGLAGVEALVLLGDGGDDVAEGGGDISAGSGPLHTGHARVGVNLRQLSSHLFSVGNNHSNSHHFTLGVGGRIIMLTLF